MVLLLAKKKEILAEVVYLLHQALPQMVLLGQPDLPDLAKAVLLLEQFQHFISIGCNSIFFKGIFIKLVLLDRVLQFNVEIFNFL